MSCSRIGNCRHRLALLLRCIRSRHGREGHFHSLFDHLDIMNAAPEMAPVWHVTGLALDAFLGIDALTPLLIRIFNELAIQGKITRVKLVIAFTELGALKRHALGKSPMWQDRFRWQGRQLCTPWWALPTTPEL